MYLTVPPFPVCFSCRLSLRPFRVVFFLVASCSLPRKLTFLIGRRWSEDKTIFCVYFSGACPVHAGPTFVRVKVAGLPLSRLWLLSSFVVGIVTIDMNFTMCCLCTSLRVFLSRLTHFSFEAAEFNWPLPPKLFGALLRRCAFFLQKKKNNLFLVVTDTS